MREIQRCTKINGFKVVVPYRFSVSFCSNRVIFPISLVFRGVTVTRWGVAY